MLPAVSKLRPLVRPLCVTACLCVAPLTTFQPAQALGRLDIALEGDQNDSLLGQLTAASLLKQAQNNGTTEAQDLFSSALADYQRLLETLYAEGYYSATIRIAIDGREAALIPPLSPPNTIDQIAVTVDPGPQFKFTTTSIAPIPADTDLPNGFQTGQIARSSDVLAAVRTSIDTWREDGHAKARVAQQSLEADHRAHTLSATVQIDPGPPLTFGALIPSGDSAVRPERIKAIAGLPTGQQFSPSELETAANRLRRTGAFQSVATTEAETPTPDQQLDIGVEVVDALPRRFGAGVELSTQDGLSLSGFWLHRNLLGGAERLRFDIEIAGIAGQSSGMDYALSTRFDRPAIYGADTAGFALLDVSSINEPSYSADAFKAGLGVSRIFGPGRTGELGLTFSYAETNDVYGARYFTLLEVPVSFQQDRRDTVLNPSSGHYLDVTLTPFIGLAGEQHGAQLKFDGRVYKALQPVSGGRDPSTGWLCLWLVFGRHISGLFVLFRRWGHRSRSILSISWGCRVRGQHGGPQLCRTVHRIAG